MVHTMYRICKVLNYINIDYALCHANTDVSYLLAFQYKAPFLRLKTHLFHSCYGKTSYIQYSKVYLLTENCSFEHEIGHCVSASLPEQSPQRCEVYQEVRLLIDVKLSCGFITHSVDHESAQSQMRRGGGGGGGAYGRFGTCPTTTFTCDFINIVTYLSFLT